MPRFLTPVRLMLLGLLTGSLLGACSSTDPFGPSVGLSLDVRQPAALPSTLHVVLGTSTASLHVDATSSAAGTTLHVTGYGEKLARLTLLDAQSDTLASVSFPKDLQAGYDYGISAFVSRTRPMGICVGAITATSLRNSPSDSLFVADFGIPKGAVC